MQLPQGSAVRIIDVSAIHGDDQVSLFATAASIGKASREIGFFYIVGHGVDGELMRDVFAMSKRFFAQPKAYKDAISMLSSPHNRGYVSMGGERLNPGTPTDLKEAYNIGLDLSADDDEVLAGKPFRGVNMWPELPGFKETMLAYYSAAWGLGTMLHRSFSIDLGLPMDYFDDKFDRPMATLRLLRYPPMPRAHAAGQMGAGEHTDYGTITLLATDDVGGLEVQTREGQWLAVPPVEGAFVCNIGDCLMRWSNDIYVSTPHRVLNRYGRERYSVAFFLDANPDTIVAPLPGVAGDAPGKYAPVKAWEFLRSRLEPGYAHVVRKD